ncbi:unnamed protein product [Linum tenue]|uniref:Uncharacterized protein n=1 Tax=Linum tenue TaxID=586396 RepID=A0AAV0MHT7_9ROSI|nr:unnamed protein product [Linum tenue]
MFPSGHRNHEGDSNLEVGTASRQGAVAETHLSVTTSTIPTTSLYLHSPRDGSTRKAGVSTSSTFMGMTHCQGHGG